MKVLYHVPSLDSIYAHRTIYHGFKNAFVDLKHEFRPFTADDNLKETLEVYRPDLFITSSHWYYRKYLDFNLLRGFREEGLFVLTKIDFWDSPLSALRINEAISLKNDKKFRELVEKNLMGDAYFHVVEQDDERMHGFSEGTGQKFHSVPLAADKTIPAPGAEEKFAADISYIGTCLPDKREFFNRHVFPLKKNYELKIYGQDWTQADRALGWAQRAGQYFNFKPLAQIRKPQLRLDEEGKVYSSSVISINVHEAYQVKFGGDCNERTFKIPLWGGFEVVDNVACIKKYFEKDKEMTVAESPKDWVEKVQHYLKYPEQRNSIIEAGRKRVLKDHTYHNRVQQMISIKEGRRP
jgi:spore maturation protein CgeB